MSSVHDGWTPEGGVGQRNWTRALETYRSALSTYRRLMEINQGRRMYLPPDLLSLPVAEAPASSGYPPSLTCLTAREREVARLIARGYTNQQIAEALVLTRGTVANHVAHILSKVGAANRTQIAAHVLEGEGRPSAG